MSKPIALHVDIQDNGILSSDDIDLACFINNNSIVGSMLQGDVPMNDMIGVILRLASDKKNPLLNAKLQSTISSFPLKEEMYADDEYRELIHSWFGNHRIVYAIILAASLSDTQEMSDGYDPDDPHSQPGDMMMVADDQDYINCALLSVAREMRNGNLVLSNRVVTFIVSQCLHHELYQWPNSMRGIRAILVNVYHNPLSNLSEVDREKILNTFVKFGVKERSLLDLWVNCDYLNQCYGPSTLTVYNTLNQLQGSDRKAEYRPPINEGSTRFLMTLLDHVIDESVDVILNDMVVDAEYKERSVLLIYQLFTHPQWKSSPLVEKVIRRAALGIPSDQEQQQLLDDEYYPLDAETLTSALVWYSTFK